MLLVRAISRLERALHPDPTPFGEAARRTTEVRNWPDFRVLQSCLAKLCELHEDILATWKLQAVCDDTALYFRKPGERKAHVPSDTVVIPISNKWPRILERDVWDGIAGTADRIAEALRTKGIDPESVGDSTADDFARVLQVVETSGVRDDDGGYLVTDTGETQGLVELLIPSRSGYVLTDIPDVTDPAVRLQRWQTPQVKSVSDSRRAKRRFVWVSSSEDFRPKLGMAEHHADTCRRLTERRPEGRYFPAEAMRHLRLAAGNRPSTPPGVREVPSKPKRKRGRKPKAKPDAIDRVIRQMIDSGDVQRHGRKWKALLDVYRDKLPRRVTPDALRKRVERAEAPRQADNK